MSPRITFMLPVLAAALPVAVVALPHDWRFFPLHVVVFAAILAVAWRRQLVDHLLEGVPARRWLLMAGASAALVWTLVGGSPRANWGMIDDHEIRAMIGPGRDRLPVRELPARIAAHPEIGSPPFTFPRYRPAYYLFRLVESSAWGRHIEPWMIVRLGLFVVTATLAFDLLRQWQGFVTGGVALAFLATLWMWPKTFATLGPSEPYAAPAVMAFAWCAAAILRGPRAAGAGLWACLALAGLVAIGAKENFVILAPLTLLVAGIEWRRGRVGTAGALACCAVTAAALWVATVVGVSIAAQGGRDVYSRRVDIAGFARSGDASSRRAVRKLVGYGLPLLLATAAMGVAWYRSRGGATGRRTELAVGAVLGITALSQFLFYRGEVFKKCHYDLPFVPLVCVLGIGLLAAVAAWPGGAAPMRRLRRRLLVPGVMAAVALAFGGDHARRYVEDYVRDTTAFQADLQRLADACHGSPDRPVEFLCSGDPGADYEAFFSVVRYLSVLGVTNPLFLNPQGIPDTDGRATLSREGGQSFEPWSSFDHSADAILVCLSADPPTGRRTSFRFN